ncbi:hypothetical protein [Bacillus cereus]|uniref:hypothetical protein n=1 Tax=Bacillus cereus TaxID=1396 RepID=UPI000BEE3B82|nr:hypothetical protein [Bacillus cereus]PDY77400.1 hypothetical protein CON06_26770 [Bacillus cereus]PFA13206.1 hypothetical protein CN382_14065 [Bacillus cereus]PFM33706.1 hypothetical protein COJ43_25515 [Bacillus cereus]
MKSQKELIYHFREFWDFEYICLEKKGLGFPELEEVMLKYNMHKSDENLEFKECWIHREFVDGEELRTVQIIYEDSKINRVVRLWGSKRNKDGKVLAMTMDFSNIETEELECEINLMKDKTFECINHRNRAPFN